MLRSLRRFALSPLACRMATSKFVRDRKHMNVGTMGAFRTGKTTLTSAITQYLEKRGHSEFFAITDLDKSPDERSKGYSINSATIEYQTPATHFCHVDCPGNPDYLKNAITGAARMDTAILVASSEGVDTGLIEQVILAKQSGVKSIVVYVNKAELIKDEEVFDLVKMEIQDVLTKYGFDGKNAFFVRGSAELALKGERPELGEESIKQLLDIFDNKLTPLVRELDKPFSMHVGHTLTMTGRGPAITGMIDTGKVKVGDIIDIVGVKPTTHKATILTIDSFDKSMNQAEAGDCVKMFLRGVDFKDLTRGQRAVASGTSKMHKHMIGKTYLLTEQEGGKSQSLATGHRPQMFVRTADIAVTINLPEGMEKIEPGQTANVNYKLDKSLFIDSGSKFTIREGGKTIAIGDVISTKEITIEELTEKKVVNDAKKRKMIKK